MYVPDQGDIIYLSLDPQAGHEQKGRRPVLVVSTHDFNRHTRMVMVCPITNTDRHSPLHVRLGDSCETTGVVMCDQVKSLDLLARNPEYIDRVPDGLLFEVVDIIKGFMDP